MCGRLSGVERNARTVGIPSSSSSMVTRDEWIAELGCDAGADADTDDDTDTDFDADAIVDPNTDVDTAVDEAEEEEKAEAEEEAKEEEEEEKGTRLSPTSGIETNTLERWLENRVTI